MAEYSRLQALPGMRTVLQLESAHGADRSGGMILTDLHGDGQSKFAARKLLDEMVVPFGEEFVADIASGVQYADALERHVTGRGNARRSAAIQTLQAVAGLPAEDLSGLLSWAKTQKF
ncbi:hypothetical protein [Janthinobacterium sp. CAN_S7]|uniref:hypothetical protein n=1 Tax=Janthinobacterium sp. CAN_S7 TaxID=3071704 RepID=UPI00319DABA6